jgi:hypothetical protein
MARTVLCLLFAATAATFIVRTRRLRCHPEELTPQQAWIEDEITYVREQPLRRIVHRTLDQRLDFTCGSEPLQDVLQRLGRVSGMPITARWDPLAKAGVLPVTPVTMSLRQVRLGKLLWAVLEVQKPGGPGLGWSADEREIIISTAADLGSRVCRHEHYIGDLLDREPDRPDLGSVLAELLESSVNPGAWKSNGGDYASIEVAGDHLVIIATSEDQRSVHELMRQVRATLRFPHNLLRVPDLRR